MIADFTESGELVYVRGSELRNGGKDGEGGLGVEPMCGEDGLDESINSGVGVKGSWCFLVGASRVIDKGREVMKVKGDMDWTASGPSREMRGML